MRLTSSASAGIPAAYFPASDSWNGERSMSIDEHDSPHAPALIRELFRVLPPPGKKFPLRARLAWLMGAAALLDVVYQDGTPPARVRLIDGKIEVMQ